MDSNTSSSDFFSIILVIVTDVQALFISSCDDKRDM